VVIYGVCVVVYMWEGERGGCVNICGPIFKSYDIDEPHLRRDCL